MRAWSRDRLEALWVQSVVDACQLRVGEPGLVTHVAHHVIGYRYDVDNVAGAQAGEGGAWLTLIVVVCIVDRWNYGRHRLAVKAVVDSCEVSAQAGGAYDIGIL